MKEENGKNLKIKINEIENNNKKENDQLNKKIEDLNKENSLLTIAVNKDIGTLNHLHKIGFLTNIEGEEESIKIIKKK